MKYVLQHIMLIFVMKEADSMCEIGNIYNFIPQSKNGSQEKKQKRKKYIQ